jgi:hypothetical protein
MPYPTFAQLEGSTMRIVDDRDVVRDTGGAARASVFFDAVKHAFTLQHRLAAADLATLRAYYASNRTASFTFVWSLDGATYTVIFGAGGVRATPRAVHHDVSVELEEV